MIKPSDAIKTLADDYFKKAEKEMNEKIIKDYINSIYGYHVDTDSVPKDIEAYRKLDEEVTLREFDKFIRNKDGWKQYDNEWEDFSKHMNKPTKAIKIFYSQPMHDKTEDEIKDKIDRLDNYIYGILMYGGFKQEDIERVEIIDNFNHEGLDADAGRLKHLGASIQLMEDADLVIFDKDWDKARGCKVELNIAEEYMLHYLHTCKDNFPILLSNWFERFLENENVSK